MKNYLRSSILAFGILSAAILPVNVAQGQSIRSNIAPRNGGITMRMFSAENKVCVMVWFQSHSGPSVSGVQTEALSITATSRLSRRRLVNWPEIKGRGEM